MPIICRLLQLEPGQVDALVSSPDRLSEAVTSARIYSDVYRYWHGIEQLLTLHRPEAPAAAWLGLGRALPPVTPDLPPARVLLPEEVVALDAVVREVEPDALAPDYDAAAFDAAGVYPQTWARWEETFDPLGQTLEHYSFLQQFVAARAGAGDGMLLLFEFLHDGSDD